VTAQDITWIRGSGKINAGREKEVVGKKINKVILEGDFLTPEHLVT
jgi:hypothetical protein